MTLEQFLAWQAVDDALAKLDRNPTNPMAQYLLRQRIRKLRAVDPSFRAQVDLTHGAGYARPKGET